METKETKETKPNQTNQIKQTKANKPNQPNPFLHGLEMVAQDVRTNPTSQHFQILQYVCSLPNPALFDEPTRKMREMVI